MIITSQKLINQSIWQLLIRLKRLKTLSLNPNSSNMWALAAITETRKCMSTTLNMKSSCLRASFGSSIKASRNWNPKKARKKRGLPRNHQMLERFCLTWKMPLKKILTLWIRQSKMQELQKTMRLMDKKVASSTLAPSIEVLIGGSSINWGTSSRKTMTVSIPVTTPKSSVELMTWKWLTMSVLLGALHMNLDFWNHLCNERKDLNKNRKTTSLTMVIPTGWTNIRLLRVRLVPISCRMMTRATSLSESMNLQSLKWTRDLWPWLTIILMIKKKTPGTQHCSSITWNKTSYKIPQSALRMHRDTSTRKLGPSVLPSQLTYSHKIQFTCMAV